MLCDFANICQSGDKLEDFIRRFEKRCVHAHIKDVTLNNVRGATGIPLLGGGYMHEAEIGKGDIDIDGAIKFLSECGYDGCFGIEYGSPDTRDRIDDAVSYLDSVMKN